MQNSRDLVLQRQRIPLLLRALGIILLGVIAWTFPSVGENRFLLGGLLIFLIAPMALTLERFLPMTRFGPTQPAFDVLITITVIHLAPNAWHAALIAGGLTANSTSVHLCKTAAWSYPILNAVFLTGMVLAAVIHEVPQWHLPILAYLACLPSLTSYVHWNVSRYFEMTERSQRLQNLSLIAGGVAHDFNNILAGILGYADLAKTQVNKGQAPVEALDSLLTNTRRAKLLTGQLLAFANRELRSETRFELVSEVEELIPLLKSIAKCHDIRLQSSTAEIHIRADRAQLQQVFMNLILNAAESMESRADGIVKVNLELREDDQNQSAECICTVTDTGCGIKESSLSQVFTPFYTSKQHGHGMGLACTERIVTEHEGSIEINSVFNEGTTVRVTLPALYEQRQHRQTPSSVYSLRQRQNYILIVDDDDSLRKIIRLQLQYLKYETLAASSGEEAVEILRASPDSFDCILMDLKMPGIDGWTCRRIARQLSPQTPVIIMSGFAPTPPADEEHIQPEFFLSKPFSQQSLTETLEVAVGSNPMSLSKDA